MAAFEKPSNKKSEGAASVSMEDSVKTNVVKASNLKKKNGLTIGLVSIAAVVVVGGSAYGAYNWYQAPQKVITDSLVSMITTTEARYFTGSFVSESNGNKVSVEVTAKQSGPAGSLNAKFTINVEGKSYDINGDALFDNSGNLYFKVENLATVASQILEGTGIPAETSMTDSLNNLVDKIDGVWVKISSDDIKQFSEETSTAQKCFSETAKKYASDKNALTEIADNYNKNQFIKVSKELGQKDGSFGYELKGDKEALKEFVKKLEDSKIFKAFKDCDSTFEIDSDQLSASSDEAGEGTIELWVDVWSHKVTKLELKGDSNGDKLNATIIPKYGEKVEINAPSSSISVSELQSYINDFMMSISSLMYGGATTDFDFDSSQYDDYYNY